MEFSANEIIKRIDQRLKALDLSENKASVRSGLSRDAIRSIRRNARSGVQRGVSTETLRKLARGLETTPEWLIGGVGSGSADVDGGELPPGFSEEGTPQGIPTLGDVAAGVWREVTAADAAKYGSRSTNPADPRYPATAQYDLVVRGSSIDRVARDGDRLRCVDLRETGLDVSDGDLVVVERRREGGHLVETTAKRVRQRGAKRELWPDSDDPQWQEPISYGEAQGDAVEIIALVLYAYRPTRV